MLTIQSNANHADTALATIEDNGAVKVSGFSITKGRTILLSREKFETFLPLVLRKGFFTLGALPLMVEEGGSIWEDTEEDSWEQDEIDADRDYFEGDF